MQHVIEPLIQDDYQGFPSKRSLNFLLGKRKEGVYGVGVYCTYAPVELIRAAGAVPITLCAYANKTIQDAEQVLPSNLCPLIKSSYGFIITNTCPFFELSEIVVAETTCDGKKKMFELISEIKPMHIMDLPQVPDTIEAAGNWGVMISKLKTFLETNLNCTITNESIEDQICQTNTKNRTMMKLFDYASHHPPVISWQEMYDVIAIAQVAPNEDFQEFIAPIFLKLDERVICKKYYGNTGSPRVLVTGCPVNGDSAKVLRTIDEAGAVVVALEGCSGFKPFLMNIDECTGDPIDALAKAYLSIPCSCMTPNTKRLDCIDNLIERYKPDIVVDIILQACHSYNIESYKIEQHIKNRHSLPFLKIETDYSTSDIERIRMRIEATLEQIRH